MQSSVVFLGLNFSTNSSYVLLFVLSASSRKEKRQASACLSVYFADYIIRRVKTDCNETKRQKRIEAVNSGSKR